MSTRAVQLMWIRGASVELFDVPAGKTKVGDHCVQEKLVNKIQNRFNNR